MYEHHLNANRAHQRQRDYEEQAAAERDLRALRREQALDAPAVRSSNARRLLAALVLRLQAGRARLAQRRRGVA
jgi:hypothetical protein